MKRYRADLKQMDHQITSRWLDEEEEIDPPTGDPRAAKYAYYDMEDIFSSDAIICFTEEANSKYSRGGRHVEFGLAIASNKELFVIGPRENIFYHIRSVHHYTDWNDFKSRAYIYQ